MCVLDPLKVVLTNFPEGETEWIEAPYWPHDIPKEGSRRIPLSREIYIEREDFMEDPPRKFHRLSPGEEVRLRYGYVIRCDDVVKDDAGEIVELRCTFDPETRSGSGTGRSVKGTVHWVSTTHGIPVNVRLYDRLMRVPDPDDVPEGRTFRDHLNADSLVELDGCIAEPSLAGVASGERYQFERLGFFFVDPVDSGPNRPVFNRTITLRDTWKKIADGADEGRAVESGRDVEAGRAENKGRPPGDSRAADAGDVSAARLSSEPDAAGKQRDPLEALAGDRRAEAVGLIDTFGISSEDASILAGETGWADYFRAAARSGDASAVANWLIQEMRPALGDLAPADSRVAPGQVAALVDLLSRGEISSRIAREVFTEMLSSGDNPGAVIERKGLSQISDEGIIDAIVESVLAEHSDRVDAYRAGKTGLMGFFVGRVMEKTRGKANPGLVRDILSRRLG
jgi:glutaminyl-tRNA synthetase